MLIPGTNRFEHRGTADSASPVSSNFQMPAWLLLWHLTSLDAPTVAVVWVSGFAWGADVRLPVWVPVLLALVVWVIYVCDRLLDARADLRTSQIHLLRERHHFHYRHRKLLLPMALSAACVAAWIVFSLMPVGARERNSVLAVAAGAYFSGVHSSRKLRKRAFPIPTSLKAKEPYVGLLFAFGCALPALSRAAGGPGFYVSLWSAVAFFAALAWLNCYAIERWESANKLHRGLWINQTGNLLGSVGLLLATVFFSNQPRSAALIAAGAASALLLAQLDRFQSRITPLTLRICADLVLLSPVLVFASLVFPR